MTASEHFCYDCAFKHLSCARILWNEINNGYDNTDHISYMIGNMALAETHIFELHPDIAYLIRDGRKQAWEGILAGEVVRPDFETYLNDVYNAAITITDNDNKLAEAIKLDLNEEGGTNGEEEG